MYYIKSRFHLSLIEFPLYFEFWGLHNKLWMAPPNLLTHNNYGNYFDSVWKQKVAKFTSKTCIQRSGFIAFLFTSKTCIQSIGFIALYTSIDYQYFLSTKNALKEHGKKAQRKVVFCTINIFAVQVLEVLQSQHSDHVKGLSINHLGMLTWAEFILGEYAFQQKNQALKQAFLLNE